MEPNKPKRTKTPRPPVTVRNLFNHPPVGLSQPGIGIIANDSLRRPHGEVVTSSATTFTGVSQILGRFLPSSGSRNAVARTSLSSFDHGLLSSGYQMASPPSEPTATETPTDLSVTRYYVEGGESGGYVDTSGGASSEVPINLSNYTVSINNQTREGDSEIGEFNEPYNMAMNVNEEEQLQQIPLDDGHYGHNHELQQASWSYPQCQPNPDHLGMLENLLRSADRPPADVLRPGLDQPPPHFLPPVNASHYNPETYRSPGSGFILNDARQYLVDERSNLQRLNQGSQQQYEMGQKQYFLMRQQQQPHFSNQPHISNDAVISECLMNTAAALPLVNQFMSSNDANIHFHELQQPYSEPTCSVIMHTNNVVSNSHTEGRLAEPPVIPAQVELPPTPTPKKKRGAPRKPRVSDEMEQQQEQGEVEQNVESTEFFQVFNSVIETARINDKNRNKIGLQSSIPNIPDTQGDAPDNVNARIEVEVPNELMAGESSDKLAHPDSLITDAKLSSGLESVDQGGDLRITQVCSIVPPRPTDPVLAGEVPAPQIREPTVLPLKKQRRKAEPKPKPTIPGKPRTTNIKTKDHDPTSQTQPTPTKGRRVKKVSKKELDQAKMGGTMFGAAVGTVLGKDAAKSCEEEQDKATNIAEKVVASSEVVSLMELASKLPDLTVSVQRLPPALVSHLKAPKETTVTTAPDEDSNATCISTVEQAVDSKSVRTTEEIESDYETDGGSICQKRRGRKSTGTSGATSRNRTRRRVSLDVTSCSDSGGDDEDYTPRTTRSRSAKVKCVSSSSGRSATGIDSDSRSPAGQRQKSRDNHEGEEALNLNAASAVIKQEVEEDEDQSFMQEQEEQKTSEELIKQEGEMKVSHGNCLSKSASGSRNRKPIKLPVSGVRRVPKPNQFRKKKSVGRPRLKENGIKIEEESADDVHVVPSQDCFLDDSTPNSPRKRGRSKNKKAFAFDGATGENADNDDGVEGESGKFFHYRRPTYNEDETKALYGDKKYVLDVRDIDKDPSNICIWQILEKKFCLRRYFPCKFGQQQFYHSSPQHWYFAEEEFRNEAFYDRFQPLVINEASNQEHFAEGWIMEECIIQYPYVDKSFFNRMVKHVGKLETTETLRKVLTNAMPLYIMQILQPSYLPDLLRIYKEGHAQIMLDPKLKKQIADWKLLDDVIYKLLSLAGISEKCDFNQETLYLLRTFPKMRYSNKSVNKEVHCSACYPKFKRMPMVKVVFNTKPECGTPYDVHTLVEHSNPPKLENDSEFWCRNCSMAAKKYHRLAHFRYSLYRIMRQNVAKDVAMFREYDVPITDQCLLMINDVDVNWRYTVFLDLQLSMAEVDAEFEPPTSFPSPTT